MDQRTALETLETVAKNNEPEDKQMSFTDPRS
jgi:hypothetical protein